MQVTELAHFEEFQISMSIVHLLCSQFPMPNLDGSVTLETWDLQLDELRLLRVETVETSTWEFIVIKSSRHFFVLWLPWPVTHANQLKTIIVPILWPGGPSASTLSRSKYRLDAFLMLLRRKQWDTWGRSSRIISLGPLECWELHSTEYSAVQSNTLS